MKSETDDTSRKSINELIFDHSWWGAASDSEINEAIPNVDVHAKDRFGQTALFMAIRYGAFNHVKLLINLGADVNALSKSSGSALMLAAMTGSTEKIKLLLSVGADWSIRDTSFRNALSYAKANDTLRGTEIYWQLAGDANADSKPLEECISEKLQYNSQEGSDIIFGGEPSYTKIALIFDRDRRPIVIEKLWLDKLKRGETHRVLGARIDDPSLLAIRSMDLIDLSTFETVAKELDLSKISDLVDDFMKLRRQEGPPYFYLIGGHPHWGYREKHPFKIILEDQLGGNEIANGIASHLKQVPSVFCDTALRISYPSTIGFIVTEEDERLISTWAGKSADQTVNEIISRHSETLNDLGKRLRRLVYARLAEKAAIGLYSSISDEPAVDCSILQLDNVDVRWRDYDLWAGRPIDVKNATIYKTNARQNFIPKFKRSAGQDVVIAAFATSTGKYRSEQTFLGEVSAPDLKLSQRAVENAFPEAGSVEVRFDDQHLPAWAFEYPFGRIDYGELLKAYNLFADRPESILAAAIAANDLQNTRMYSQLNLEQKRIVDAFCKVVGESSYSKLTIVLFAIAGFKSETLAGRNPVKFVRFFRRIISMEALKHDYRRQVSSRGCPDFQESTVGGLPDPLNSVHSMLDLLEKSSNEIFLSGYTFTAFHTPNPYVMIGRLQNNSKLTIFAYCGGKVDGGFSCETFPLVIGENMTCSNCGKLVCHDCGYCSANCK